MLFKKMFWNLFVGILTLVGVSVVAASWYSTHEMRRVYREEAQAHLEHVAAVWRATAENLVLSALPEERKQQCRNLQSATGHRVTLIAADGTVLADTDEDPEAMDNHAGRPEVRQAREQGYGAAIRYSHTIRKHLMYYALRLDQNGETVGYLRLAYPVSAIETTLHTVRVNTIAFTAFVLLIAGLIAMFFAQQITVPLKHMTEAAESVASGDFDRRVPYSAVDEVHRLADAFNRMVVRLQLAMRHNARQAAEISAVLNNMAEGVIAVDREQRVVSLNDAAIGLLGISTDQPVGKLVGEIVGHADILEAIRETLTERRAVRMETTLREPNGSEIRVEIRGNPLGQKDQYSAGAVLVIHDITRLWQMEKVRRDFVANVSHELKTPITSIKGAAETLMDGAADDPASRLKFLDIIRRHADRLGAIITDLLALARLEQEEESSKVVRQPTPIGALLRDAVQICDHRANEKNIALEVTCPSELAATVAPDLLVQAVVNLLDNAIKYSEPGQSVRVAARSAGDQCEIRVEDRGCGIPPEHLARIFERFYRVDKARSRAIGGTGLGLAIVKHIVQLHKGTVEVESTVGKGSVFTIRIPRDAPIP